MYFKKGAEVLKICEEKKMHLYDLVIDYEKHIHGISEEEISEKMRRNLEVMIESVHKGLDEESSEIKGKIIGGEAKKLKKRYEKIEPVCGAIMARAVSYALSVMEVNASMGRIVASPTAGSCGILPAVLLSLHENYQIKEQQLIKGLLSASAVGIIIAKNATLSGAEGGCQAEVGSAAAMAASATVEIMGGTPRQALDAAAIALKNLMGLICDPIAGLVESPCSKRNGIGTANALIAAEMALAGIQSVVPFDEVVEAMYKVGKMMPCAVRETSQGGIAITPRAKKIEKDIFFRK